MGNLYLCEWKKLFRQRFFIVVSLALLLGNILLLVQYEKQTEVYTFFYQQKQQWQKYQKGDTHVSKAEVYQSFVENEENYVNSYGDFLKQVPEQADTLKQTENYQQRNTYLYRDLEKTVQDYKKLSADGITADPSIGVKELASYNYGIYVQMVFLIVLAYFVVSSERKKGLFLLTKGTRRGHLPFVSVKTVTMLSAGIAYSLLQECGNLGVIGWLYGYGDLNRKIQSISIFRDCSLSITVGQGLLGVVLVRVAVCVFCTVFMACLTILFRREGTAILIYSVFVGVEMFLEHSIGMSSSLAIFKCVNVFFCWDMHSMFGTYKNLNIFGYPINQWMVVMVVALVFIALLLILSFYAFSSRFQISSGNLWEGVKEKIAGITSFRWHHTSVYRFEFRKVFYQEKKGFVMLFLLIWCLLSTKDVLKPAVYDTAASGEYHRILSKISGPVTEKSLTYIQEQREELQAINKQLEKLKYKSTKAAQTEQQLLMHELEMREEGTELVEEQRDLLLQKKGNILNKFWMDEKSYLAFFYDYKYDLIAFFIATVALVLWISDMESADARKGLYSILYTTKAGKAKIRNRKGLVCLTGMFFSLISMLIPQCMRYYNIDHFKSVKQSLADITSLHFTTTMSVGSFLFILLLAKIVLFGIVCGFLFLLVRKIPNASIVIGIGVGLIGVAILLLWYFHMDMTIFILRMLTTAVGG